MVTFKANVYHEDNDNLIGAEVIVYDGETPIDSICITPRSSYVELREEIYNLSSHFVSFCENSELSGQTIEDILSNSENEIIINASLLNGHSADYYAKASQISDLYNYDISLSSYNIVVGDNPETVTVTVKVTNSAGAAVSNQQVSLSIDGNNYPGTTNANGKFSMNYSISEGGLHTFSVKNQKVQLLAKDTWKTLYSNNNITLQNKEDKMRLFYTDWDDVLVTGSWKTLKTFSDFLDYMPKNIDCFTFTIYSLLYRLTTDGKFQVASMSGNREVPLVTRLEWTI